MFKLVVMLFLMGPNGELSDDPASWGVRKTLFPTQETCMAFFDTDEGKAEKQMIEARAAALGGVMKFECRPSDHAMKDIKKGDDGSI
jgi:hypothetical protein